MLPQGTDATLLHRGQHGSDEGCQQVPGPIRLWDQDGQLAVPAQLLRQ
jgi:hypothetical protein